jgi:hypothetical protein
MADTALNSASRIQKWDENFLSEYVRASRFKPYMGKASGSGSNPMMPIMIKSELTSAGKIINIPLITRLQGDGVQGNTQLAGAEEALGNYNRGIAVHYNRNGVRVNEADEHWTEMNLREAARMQLRTWAAEALRDDIIIAMLDVFSVTAPLSRVRGQNATEASSTAVTVAEFITAINADQASLDAWLAANNDRILFGVDPAHTEGDDDFSDSVVKLTDGTDGFCAATLDEAKWMAKTADPHIRPIRVNDDEGREYFVVFCSPWDFKNAKADPTIQAYNKDARPRNVDTNPLFQDGDLIYDGMILREVPEIPSWGGIGAGPADLVSASFLCGAQAVGVAWGMKPQSRTRKDDDYGHFYGTGITESRGVGKMFFNSKQHGMVTIFSTQAANSA